MAYFFKIILYTAVYKINSETIIYTWIYLITV